MPETGPHEDQRADSPPEETPRASRGMSRPTPEELSAAATRVGGMLGRFARRARAAGEQAAAEARPEAERLARQALAAAEAARPHVERAGRDAARYVREHDQEIKDAAKTGARITAMRAVPIPFRPVVDALGAPQPRPPLRAAPPPEGDPASPPSHPPAPGPQSESPGD